MRFVQHKKPLHLHVTKLTLSRHGIRIEKSHVELTIGGEMVGFLGDEI
jgi:hypothetical protein